MLCQSPAMLNERCRMHSGQSPGAPTGEISGNYRHEMHNKKAIADRRYMQDLINQAVRLAKEI